MDFEVTTAPDGGKIKVITDDQFFILDGLKKFYEKCGNEAELEKCGILWKLTIRIKPNARPRT